MSEWPIITLLTFTPLAGAVMIVGLDPQRPQLARGLGLTFSCFALVFTSLLIARFNPAAPGLQFVELHAWIPAIGAEYFVGIDGLSLLLVALTALLVPFSLLASRIHDASTRLFVALVLLLQTALFGAFTALNFFHWFLFWELSLVPAFFLIKLWGGPQRSAAAVQFFLYTFLGSIALLLAMLAVFAATGTMDFIELARIAKSQSLAALLSAKLSWAGLPARSLAMIVFLGALLGFAVKVPLMPFHTWLPLTYAEAPTPVTMLLTGAMSKMGVYGFLRILLPIFPEQMRAALTPLLWLAVLTIVASALAAIVQRDLKRMLAYSSINHLGYCLIGLFATLQVTGPEPAWTGERVAALSGVLLQMFNHGLTAAALFCFVGLIEQRSGGLRGLDEFGGLRKVAPVFCGLMGVSVFASLGLPGLNGFIGEFLIFKGTFGLVKWAAVISTFGLLATAVFLLTFMQRVWSGPLNGRWQDFPDLTLRERLLVLPATALMFVLGFFPQLVIQFINPTVLRLAESLKS